MRDGVQQGRAQLLALSCCLGAAEILNGTHAFNRDCNQAAHGIERCARDGAAQNAEASHGAHSQAYGHDGYRSSLVHPWLSPSAHHLQFNCVQPARRRPGPVHFGAVGQKDRCRLELKTIHHVFGQQVEQFEHVVAGEQLLAEGVEAFHVAAPLVSIGGFALSSG